MKKIRFIPRLDVKGTRVVKGIYYEGWRDIGDPAEMAKQYYEDGADELLYLDIFASLTNRSLAREVITNLCKNVYVPLTVGGGIRSIEDINLALRAGADKVAINTFAIKKPSIISNASRKFGSQCIVVSIEAKKCTWGYEAYTNHGRTPSGVNVVEWARTTEALGAGEILLSSVDVDGSFRGFDLDLIKQVSEVVSVPLVIGSGAGSIDQMVQAINCGADAVAVASLLHYKRATIGEIKTHLIDRGISLRL